MIYEGKCDNKEGDLNWVYLFPRVMGPWNCESSKEVSKDHPNTLPKSFSVVMDPQPNAIQWISIHAGSPHTIKYTKSIIVKFWSAGHGLPVSCQTYLTPNKKFLKIVKVSMEHGPFDAM